MFGRFCQKYFTQRTALGWFIAGWAGNKLLDGIFDKGKTLLITPPKTDKEKDQEIKNLNDSIKQQKELIGMQSKHTQDLYFQIQDRDREIEKYKKILESKF